MCMIYMLAAKRNKICNVPVIGKYHTRFHFFLAFHMGYAIFAYLWVVLTNLFDIFTKRHIFVSACSNSQIILSLIKCDIQIFYFFA